MNPLEPLRQVARDFQAWIEPARLAHAIEAGLVLVLIAVAAWLVWRASLGLLRHTAAWRPGHPAARMTLIAEGLLRYVILFTALILMLGTVHVNVTPVLASAGVLGLALGFGAQYIIRDLLAGVFLLSEGIIEVGDVVRVDSEIGTVERVSLRTTQIRKFSGELLTVPNGTIGRIGNLSRGYAMAIAQIPVPYTADIGAALDALGDAGRAWAAARAAAPPPARGEATANPSVDGVVELRDGGAVLQLSVLVPLKIQDAVASDLRRRAIEALARRGITPGWIPTVATQPR